MQKKFFFALPFFLLQLLFGCFSKELTAQILVDTTKPDTSIIQILHIDQLRNITTVEGSTIEMLGRVELKQKNSYFWCDSGYIYPDNRVKAFGNVQIDQNDSIHIFSDSLFYSGMYRKAQLKKEVVLQDSTATIFTQLLNYDLNTRIAEYPEGVLIVSDSTEILSKRGYYDANKNMAHFRDSVRVTNPKFKLVSDSLDFNTLTEVVYFKSKTLVYDSARFIYCEKGYYDSKAEYGVFAQKAYYLNRDLEKGTREKATGDTIIFDGKNNKYFLIGNAKFEDGEQEVTADSIVYDKSSDKYYFRGHPNFRSLDSTNTQQIKAGNSFYNKETGMMIFTEGVRVVDKGQILISDTLQYHKENKSGIAQGHVSFKDTIQNVEIQSGTALYNDSTKYVKAYDNPVFSTILDGDTLWLAADTLISLPDTNDIDKERRHLYAYYNARIYKSNMQALCDSLFFNGQDSVFHLLDKPALWVDSVQFTADTIRLRLKDKKLEQVFLINNSLIVTLEDETFFNQIKGGNITVYFDSSKIRNMDVRSNGEAVYYVKDQKQRYMGVNKVECGDMFMYFKNNEITRIKFVQEPVAVLTPMGQVEHNTLRVKSFQWLEDRRPKSKADLFKRDLRNKNTPVLEISGEDRFGKKSVPK